MIGRRWGPCGRWPRQLSDAKDGRLRAGCGAAPLAHRAGVVRVGLRPGTSDRDPEIAGGAGFTEGVVRERHGDDGVGGMAGAEDIVDAAKPMLGVEGFHAWGRDLVALDGREVVDEEIAAALPHHVDIEDGGGHVLVVVKFGFLFNLSDMAYFGVCHTAQVSTRIPTNQLLPHCKKSSSRQKAPRKTPSLCFWAEGAA